jgi:hypothetical protein
MHLVRLLIVCLAPVCGLLGFASGAHGLLDSGVSQVSCQGGLSAPSCPEASRHASVAEDGSHCLNRRDHGRSAIPLPRVHVQACDAATPTWPRQILSAAGAPDLLGLNRTWQFRCRAAKGPRAPSPFV